MTRAPRNLNRKFARAGSVAAMVLAAAPMTAAQGILWSASGDNAGDQFGYDLTTVADVNGDGIRDVAVAAATKNSSGQLLGTIRFLDGASGAKLHDRVGTYRYPAFGVSDLHDVDGDGVEDFLSRASSDVAVWSGKTLKGLFSVADNGNPSLEAGDVDLDGVRDFALGPWSTQNVRIYSGKNGTKLLTIKAPSGSSSSWGAVIKALGDVNGDGWPDLLITDYLDNYSTGAAYVHSLKDGSQLTKILGASGSGLGGTAAADGDFDQDGITDFALGAFWETVGSKILAGAVHIYSGASFSEIARIQGTTTYEKLSLDDIAGDFDGDGVPDLVLTPMWDASANTYIRWIHSGRTTGRLYGWQSNHPTGGSFPGEKVFAGADFDGDGFGDLVISSNDGPFGSLPGTIDVHRGAPSFLTAYPTARKSPYPNGSNKGATNDYTFHFHLAGLQPGSPVSLYVVEEDGAATSTLVFAGLANAMGEQDCGAWFMPPRAGLYTYKVQAFGTDFAGASVSTNVEPILYN